MFFWLWQSSLLCHVFSRMVTQFCLIWHYPLTCGPTQWFELAARGESQGHTWACYILWALWMIQLDFALASLCHQAYCPSPVQFCLASPVCWPSISARIAFEFISLGQSHPESWILERSPKFKIWKVQYFRIKYLKIKDYNPNFLFIWVTEGFFNTFEFKKKKKGKQLRSQLCLRCSERNYSIAPAFCPVPSGIDPCSLEIEFSAQSWERGNL